MSCDVKDGYNYSANGTKAWLVPEFDAMANGIIKGTMTTLHVRTGEIKWPRCTEFPAWVSPLITNGLVFAGHTTDVGKS